MSIRTLIEVNHDQTHRLDEEFIARLRRYLCSGSREDAEALEPYGFKVIGLRHHTGRYYVEREPDGFPVIVYPPSAGRAALEVGS